MFVLGRYSDVVPIPKPHLKRCNLCWWLCSGCAVEEYGATPKKAYDHWLTRIKMRLVDNVYVRS